jgi:hypothetical protein
MTIMENERHETGNIFFPVIFNTIFVIQEVEDM